MAEEGADHTDYAALWATRAHDGGEEDIAQWDQAAETLRDRWVHRVALIDDRIDQWLPRIYMEYTRRVVVLLQPDNDMAFGALLVCESLLAAVRKDREDSHRLVFPDGTDRAKYDAAATAVVEAYKGAHMIAGARTRMRSSTATNDIEQMHNPDVNTLPDELMGMIKRLLTRATEEGEDAPMRLSPEDERELAQIVASS